MSQVECPLCAVAMPPMNGEMVWVRCASCQAMIFRDTGGPEVLVAHDSDPISKQIGAALVAAGYAPVRVEHGRDAVRLLDARAPVAAVLDVALTDLMSFQVIDHIRRSEGLGEVKVVLVASVFNRTAYKRRPETLHGADGYVEQHHITDHLPERLALLLDRPVPTSAHPMGEEMQQELRDGETRTDLVGGERVAALARSIVADIALYHEAEVLRAAAGDESALTDQLGEGRRLLQEMADASEIGDGDPIGSAFADMLRTLESSR